MIKIRCYHYLEDVAELRSEMDALNLQARRPCPFSSLAYFENYRLRIAPAGAPSPRLWFLAAFEDGRLVGYMVLKASTEHLFMLPCVRLDFLVSHHTDRPHLVCRSDQEAEVRQAYYEYLLSRQSEWDHLEFQQQDASSALLPMPAVMRGQHYLMRRWPCLDNATIPLHWATLDEYVKSLAQRFRSNLGRQARALLAAGHLQYLNSGDPQSTPALLALFRSIEPRSWKARAELTAGDKPLMAAFYQGLLDPLQPMKISIQVLLLDGVPIAGLVCGRFNDTLYALDTLYDERALELSPGSALLLMTVRHAIQSNCRSVNLLSGFSYYKHRWLAEITPTFNVQLYRFCSLPYWHRLLGDLKRRLPWSHENSRIETFNPLRRELSMSETELDARVFKPVLDPVQRQRIDTLIAEARRGHGEFLEGAALAAVTPFRTAATLRKPMKIAAPLSTSPS